MIIETHNLSKRYGSVQAVCNLNLRVPQGGITAFLGPNGHGKTTTIKMLLGMTRPTSGTGEIMGYSITDQKESLEIRRNTAFASEDKQLYGYMTIRQILAFTRGLFPSWQAQRERELILKLELPLDRKIKQLSKGMRTKLALLLTLARRVKLFILDEPSEGLDPVSTEDMLEMVVGVAAEGASVFFSTHQLSEAERIADYVFILKQGQVVAEGRLDELRERFRRVIIVFPNNPPSDELAALKLRNVHSHGNLVTALADVSVDAIEQRIRHLGAISVEFHAMGLREFFLECVGEDRRDLVQSVA